MLKTQTWYILLYCNVCGGIRKKLFYVIWISVLYIKVKICKTKIFFGFRNQMNTVSSNHILSFKLKLRIMLGMVGLVTLVSLTCSQQAHKNFQWLSNTRLDGSDCVSLDAEFDIGWIRRQVKMDTCWGNCN